MKNWPKIQYNQVQFGINASLEINEKACDCSLFTGRRYVYTICPTSIFNFISLSFYDKVESHGLMKNCFLLRKRF